MRNEKCFCIILLKKSHFAPLLKVFLPAFSQSVVAEMQNELMKRVRLLSDLLLLFLLHFGLGFLWKHENGSILEHRGNNVDWKSEV